MHTLRIPLRLLANRELIASSAPVRGGDYEFSLSQRDDLWILTITGFARDEDARAFVAQAWAGIAWMSLQCNILADLSVEVQRVVYTEDPQAAAERLGFREPVDAWIDAAFAAVYPTGTRVRLAAAGSITALTTTSATRVLDLILEGACFPNSASLRQDRDIVVAMELYCAYLGESSPNARFLTLMMALEALASPAARPERMVAMADRWLDELTRFAGGDLSGEEQEEIQSMRSGLAFLRTTSIAGQIEELVFNTLDGAGDGDARAIASQARRLYRHRNNLVHGNGVELHVIQGAAADAQRIVQRVLRARVAMLSR